MALPLWASQVWQRQPDVQALISARNAQDARTQQAIFAGLEMQMKQQELAAQQRQFQESMALKQQQEKNAMQTKAWEMEMAQKRLDQQALVDAANIAHYNAMTAKYNREAQPPPPINAQPYPSMPGGAGTETSSQGAPVDYTSVPVDAGVSALNDVNQQMLGAQAGLTGLEAGLTGLEAGISGELSKAVEGATAPTSQEGPNPLLPPAPSQNSPERIDLSKLDEDQKFRLGLPVGQLVNLGNNTYGQRLPGNQFRIGEANSKGGIEFHPAQDIVPKATQTNEDKLALLDAKTARALVGKKATLAAVLGTKPKAVQDQVSRFTSPLLNGDTDFDVTKIVNAINDVESNAKYAAKLIADAEKYGTAQQKSAVSSTLREMDLVIRAHEGRFDPIDKEMAAREQKAYEEEIKPLKEKRATLRSLLDEKLESITGKPMSNKPAAAPSTGTPSSNIGKLREQEGIDAAAAKTSYLKSLFKTAK